MLPNLANVRRPSKSAIVNSSIAIIQSQRRNRAIAAREMRLIKAENDALRQELNEWRQRANMPRVEEPQRSTDLMAILNFNEEEEAADSRAQFDGNYLDDGDDYADDGDEEQHSPESYAPYTVPAPLSVTMPVTHNQHQHHAHLQQQQAQAVAYAQQKAAVAARVTQAQLQAQVQQLAAVARIPQTQQQHLLYGAESFFGSDAFTLPTAADNNHLFGGNWAQPQQKQANVTPQLITPPTTAHGLSTNKTASFANAANQAFLTSYAAAQNNGLGMGMYQHGGPGSAIGEDDNLSVGSGSSHHDGSSSHFSGGASTPELIMGSSPIDHGLAFGAPTGYSGQSTPPYGVQARRSSMQTIAPYLQQQGSSPTQIAQGPFANLSLMI
jgi:hypothetical protein